jgi:PadR family transcriptional regulator, regulatory protein PadR
MEPCRARLGPYGYYDASHGTMHSMVVQGDRGKDATIAQMRRGVLEYCVLALLRDEERYGFDLVRALSEVDGMVTSEGTIYPLLSRLRREGLVTTSWRESSSGPPRRYYRLSPEGMAALDSFLKQWSRFRDGVDALVKGGMG